LAQVERGYRGTAIVLAGGRSSRFGADKALAPVNGRPMIEVVLAVLTGIFPEVLIVAKNPERYRFLARRGRVRLIRDRFRADHALGGIYTGLSEAKTPYVFVCACDMPLLAPELVRTLWRARLRRMAVVPRFGGSLQPLCAVYARRCRKTIRTLIRRRRLRVQGVFEEIDTRILGERKVKVVDSGGWSFLDVDTRKDYREVKKRSRKRAAMYYKES
jgi:molybdopterin-guanine dinucleotide biosynthesis protein A